MIKLLIIKSLERARNKKVKVYSGHIVWICGNLSSNSEIKKGKKIKRKDKFITNKSNDK